MTLRRKQSKQTVEYVAPEKILCRVPGPTLQGNPAAKCPPSTTRSCGKMSGAARHKQLFFFCQTAGEPPNVSPSSESERERHWQLVRRLCHVGKTHHAQTLKKKGITGMANGIRKTCIEFLSRKNAYNFYWGCSS